MKIRTGFVSNSSSSSFVIIGEELKFEELEVLGYQLSQSGKLFACHKEDWNDGYDFFNMSQLMLANYLKWHYMGNTLHFYNVHKVFEEDYNDGININKSDIPNSGAKIYSIEVTYHRTQDFATFLQRHLQSVSKKDIVKKVPSFFLPQKKETQIEIDRTELLDFE